MTRSTIDVANMIRAAFVAIVMFAGIAAPEYHLFLLLLLLCVIAADLGFGWLKKRWQSANRDFEKIMNEELGR